MNYKSRNHAKYALTAHLVFTCKYRLPLLAVLGAEIKTLMHTIAAEKDFIISEMEVDTDHIHLLIDFHPKQSILHIVRHLKQISTYRIWRQNGNAALLQQHLHKERTFWSDGYFVSSVGRLDAAAVEKYIKNQGKKK